MPLEIDIPSFGPEVDGEVTDFSERDKNELKALLSSKTDQSTLDLISKRRQKEIDALFTDGKENDSGESVASPITKPPQTEEKKLTTLPEKPVVNCNFEEMIVLSGEFLQRIEKDPKISLRQKMSKAFPAPQGSNPAFYHKTCLNRMGKYIESGSDSYFQLQLGDFWQQGRKVGISFFSTLQHILSKYHSRITNLEKTKIDRSIYRSKGGRLHKVARY